MSIIAVDGIPLKMNLKDVVKAVARPINGTFEAINFEPTVKGFKICYIRLAEKVNPKHAVERINNSQTIRKGSKFHAFIPNHVPDLPLSIKPKKLPERLRKALRIPPNVTKQQLIHISHEHIMKEMQTKYTGLHSLSATNKHKLLKNIGQEVHNRIIAILSTNANTETCFLLTKQYRKTHPHFGDFQFILSMLHQIQDSQGKPRTQMQESDLIKVEDVKGNFTIHNIPIEKLDSVINKYTDKVNTKIAGYIEKLKENTQPENDSIEEAARIKVRQQLINMGAYLPIITREVIRNNFTPKQTSFKVVRIYGEPYLPSKEVMAPFLARHRGAGVVRNEHMYNMLSARVPAEHYAALLAADGTTLSGAKLVIRPQNVLTYKQHPSAFETKTDINMQQGHNMEMDWTDQW